MIEGLEKYFLEGRRVSKDYRFSLSIIIEEQVILSTREVYSMFKFNPDRFNQSQCFERLQDREFKKFHNKNIEALKELGVNFI